MYMLHIHYLLLIHTFVLLPLLLEAKLAYRPKQCLRYRENDIFAETCPAYSQGTVDFSAALFPDATVLSDLSKPALIDSQQARDTPDSEHIEYIIDASARSHNSKPEEQPSSQQEDRHQQQQQQQQQQQHQQQKKSETPVSNDTIDKEKKRKPLVSFEEWQKKVAQIESDKERRHNKKTLEEEEGSPNKRQQMVDSIDGGFSDDFGSMFEDLLGVVSRKESKQPNVYKEGDYIAPSQSGTDSSKDSKKKQQFADVRMKSLKERFNYASTDCAATVRKANKEAKGAQSILYESKDQYLLNKCSADKFVIINLCEQIVVDTIVMANFEFFSSTFKDFRVYASSKYPSNEWRLLGQWQARNTRDLQVFKVPDSGFVEYMKIEFLTHYGHEYYCPLSLVRVHGMTMMEYYTTVESQDQDPILEEEHLWPAEVREQIIQPQFDVTNTSESFPVKNDVDEDDVKPIIPPANVVVDQLPPAYMEKPVMIDPEATVQEPVEIDVNSEIEEETIVEKSTEPFKIPPAVIPFIEPATDTGQETIPFSSTVSLSPTPFKIAPSKKPRKIKQTATGSSTITVKKKRTRTKVIADLGDDSKIEDKSTDDVGSVSGSETLGSDPGATSHSTDTVTEDDSENVVVTSSSSTSSDSISSNSDSDSNDNGDSSNDSISGSSINSSVSSSSSSSETSSSSNANASDDDDDDDDDEEDEEDDDDEEDEDVSASPISNAESSKVDVKEEPNVASDDHSAPASTQEAQASASNTLLTGVVVPQNPVPVQPPAPKAAIPNMHQKEGSTQESIYKTIMKRLSVLEVNMTLSQRFLDEQNKILNDVFVDMEKRHQDQLILLIGHLNETASHKIDSMKRRYEQWYEDLKDQTESDMREMTAKISILADQLSFERRVSVSQLVIMIMLFVFMALSRGTFSTLSPVMAAQQEERKRRESIDQSSSLSKETLDVLLNSKQQSSEDNNGDATVPKVATVFAEEPKPLMIRKLSELPKKPNNPRRHSDSPYHTMKSMDQSIGLDTPTNIIKKNEALSRKSSYESLGIELQNDILLKKLDDLSQQQQQQQQYSKRPLLQSISRKTSLENLKRSDDSIKNRKRSSTSPSL